MSKLVIKSHRPWQMAVAIIALSMLISLLTWLLLDSNHWKVIYERLSGNQSTRDLIETNQALSDENSELRGKVMMLEQTTAVDKETAVHMQNELKGLQEEIYQLKRELEFYQGVMDAARSKTGLDVHGVYIESLGKPNQFIIKLVLTNVTRDDKVLRGSLGIDLEGYQNNRKLRLDMGKLLLSEDTDLAFELKSFKRVEYVFELPDKFAPERVLVQVNLDNSGDNSINKIYDWNVR